IPAAGPFTACVDTTGMSFADAAPRLFFYDGASWSDVTISTGTTICGTSPTIGTYALFTAAEAANVSTIVAGSGFAVGDDDGPGGRSDDDLGEGKNATVSALGLGRGGLAFDRANNLLYTTTAANIRRVNLTTGILDTIAGDGTLGQVQSDPGDPANGIPPATGIPGVSGVDPRSTYLT